MVKALQKNRFRLMGGADRHVRQVWQMSGRAFIGAIKSHFQKKYRVFCKRVREPPCDYKLYEANISVDPDSDDEAYDVYVEFRLYPNGSLITTNAHNHTGPRLPK